MISRYIEVEFIDAKNVRSARVHRNFFRTIVETITTAPCFPSYIEYRHIPIPFTFLIEVDATFVSDLDLRVYLCQKKIDSLFFIDLI